jgi:hypothetical protein
LRPPSRFSSEEIRSANRQIQRDRDRARGADTTVYEISLIVGDPPRFIIVEGLNRRQRSRVGRYMGLVEQLDHEKLSAAAFRRRVRRWRPIAGQRFLSDPEAVRAVVQRRRAADQEIFHYESVGTR